MIIIGMSLLASPFMPGIQEKSLVVAKQDMDWILYLPMIINSEPPPDESYTIHIWGRVTLADGTGLANIDICSGVTYWSSCHEPIVTRTDWDGYYDALIPCPFDHDETMSLCPKSETYAFTPEVKALRTYGSCPDLHADFVGTPKGIE